METIDTNVIDTAQHAIDTTDTTCEAVREVTASDSLTPYGVAQAVKAIGEITNQPIPDKIVGNAIRASVETYRARATNPAIIAERRRVANARQRAAAHIRKLQAGSFIEQTDT